MYFIILTCKILNFLKQTTTKKMCSSLQGASFYSLQGNPVKYYPIQNLLNCIIRYFYNTKLFCFFCLLTLVIEPRGLYMQACVFLMILSPAKTEMAFIFSVVSLFFFFFGKKYYLLFCNWKNYVTHSP